MKSILVIILFYILFISTSSVYAQTWEFVGLDSLVIFHLDVEGDTIYAGTWDRNNNLNSGLYYSSDGGSNWNRLDASLGEGAILGLERNLDNTIYIIKCPCQSGNAGNLYRTTNNGKLWLQINEISNNKIRWMRISPFNHKEIYAIDAVGVPGGLLTNLYKSNDAGVNWEKLGPFPGSSHGSELAFSFDLIDSMSLYVSIDTHFINSYLLKSTDKGENWFYLPTPPIIPKDIFTDHSIPSRIYLNPNLYVSNNGGLNWFEADSGFSGNTFYVSFYQDRSTTSLLYILNTDGLYQSRNDTLYWQRLQDSEKLPLDLPTEIRNLKNIIIDKTSREIYLGTSSGIYRKSVVTSVQGKELLAIRDFILVQNYPNPFNPVTTISYRIPEQSFINIKVYNILGKEVRTLVEEEQTAGQYELQFESNDLPSGIYFYKLTSGNYTSVKKMILMK